MKWKYIYIPLKTLGLIGLFFFIKQEFNNVVVSAIFLAFGIALQIQSYRIDILYELLEILQSALFPKDQQPVSSPEKPNEK